ncbi:hypothetical protein GCM10027169_28760 [Gordonia jinhuaensis]|uniref:Protein kinase n=1 Tax=Gordonia jinhuaensis TaxID=1517702 RepID=A0A916T9A6_9ACTN|nr:hypothetical protein [Gordonia jinhuaensis]GGB36655.1 hypothetical protein GCM10011489_25720 [Gordonia jinhuaensis]
MARFSKTNTRRIGAGMLVAAGAAAVAIGAAPTASAAPSEGLQLCPALPGQMVTKATCEAKSGPTGLALAVTSGGGKATSMADNYSGPAAIALGNGAVVTMNGVKPGLAIGIAGADSTVTVDGKKGPVCTGKFAFSGDFQTLKGCYASNGQVIPLG